MWDVTADSNGKNINIRGRESETGTREVERCEGNMRHKGAHYESVETIRSLLSGLQFTKPPSCCTCRWCGKSGAGLPALTLHPAPASPLTSLPDTSLPSVASLRCFYINFKSKNVYTNSHCNQMTSTWETSSRMLHTQ